MIQNGTFVSGRWGVGGGGGRILARGHGAKSTCSDVQPGSFERFLAVVWKSQIRESQWGAAAQMATSPSRRVSQSMVEAAWFALVPSASAIFCRPLRLRGPKCVARGILTFCRRTLTLNPKP